MRLVEIAELLQWCAVEGWDMCKLPSMYQAEVKMVKMGKVSCSLIPSVVDMIPVTPVGESVSGWVMLSNAIASSKLVSLFPSQSS